MRQPTLPRRLFTPLAAACALTLAASSALAQQPAAPPAAAANPASASAQPRYLTQMQAELQAMGLSPQCASANGQAGSCTTRASLPAPAANGQPSNRRFVLSLQYDDNSDTIYVYVDHYASVRADAPSAPQVFRRLLEMNWEMLVARFEWSSASGEIRLSAVMNTDSNFDRRAFRGVVRSVLRLADRYADDLAGLTGNPVGDTVAPTGGSSAPPAAAPAARTLPAAPAVHAAPSAPAH
ncbi:MAG: YbjN domain-containing protein [Deltaproteobacteria bacterium]